MSALLDRVVTLGREFGRRGMRDHTQELRRFYVAARDGRPSPSTWSAEFIDGWLADLRLPPFEHQLQLLPKQRGCPHCDTAPGVLPSRKTERVFPGGARMRCDTCGLRWLEPE